MEGRVHATYAYSNPVIRSFRLAIWKKVLLELAVESWELFCDVTLLNMTEYDGVWRFMTIYRTDQSKSCKPISKFVARQKRLP